MAGEGRRELVVHVFLVKFAHIMKACVKAGLPDPPINKKKLTKKNGQL